MIFAKKQEVRQLESFDRIQQLTMDILLFECPGHRTQHHILYTLNSKKQLFLETIHQLQSMQSNLTAIKQLSLETRQQILTTIHQWNNLETLYLLTANENNRHSINHTLTFQEQQLADLYSFFITEKELFYNLDRKKEFYHAIKQELFLLTDHLTA